jgi:predicted GNAT family acetyltransferase
MEFRRNADASRYELVDRGSVVAFADYVERPDAVVLPHTVVDPSRRGQGLGARIVRQALDDVRTSGRKVVPTCWYVAEFIGANTEYADLLAG